MKHLIGSTNPIDFFFFCLGVDIFQTTQRGSIDSLSSPSSSAHSNVKSYQKRFSQRRLNRQTQLGNRARGKSNGDFNKPWYRH